MTYSPKSVIQLTIDTMRSPLWLGRHSPCSPMGKCAVPTALSSLIVETNFKWNKIMCLPIRVSMISKENIGPNEKSRTPVNDVTSQQLQRQNN